MLDYLISAYPKLILPDLLRGARYVQEKKPCQVLWFTSPDGKLQVFKFDKDLRWYFIRELDCAASLRGWAWHVLPGLESFLDRAIQRYHKHDTLHRRDRLKQEQPPAGIDLV